MGETTMAKLVPRQVHCVEMRTDVSPKTLFPSERVAVTRAVPTRQAEFATVRACARMALSELGIKPAPIGRGLSGAPIWPTGVVGSMTHCKRYRAAAVSLEGGAAAIGIDAEVHAPLPSGVIELVARPEEIIALEGLARDDPAVSWDRLLFSIKEAAYKAFFPLTGQQLSFTDVSVDVARAQGTFDADILVPGLGAPSCQLRCMRGLFDVGDDLLLTAVISGAE